MTCSALSHWRLILTTVFHGLAGYSVYMYMTVLSPVELWIKDLANRSVVAHYGVDVSEEEMEWIWAGTASIQIIGVLIGCATIKYPAEKLRRRNTVMILKNIVLITLCVLQFLSRPFNSIELLIVGQILDGIAFAQTLLTPVFLAESSTTEFRGLVSSAPSLGGRLWSLSGALLPLVHVFDSETTWNYLFLCPVLPALVHLLATPLIPKSVKHLYITNEKRKLSREAIAFYHGSDADKDKVQKDMDKEMNVSPTIKVANIKVLLAAKQFRQPLVLCIVAVMMVPIGGEFLVYQYSTGVLRSIGISPSQAKLYNALLVQLPVFLVSLAGVSCLERFGRRPILLGGIAIASLGTGVLSLATPSQKLSSSLPPIVTVVGLILTVIGVTGGANLVPPVLPGELAPQSSRSLTYGISRFSGTFILFIFGFVFPPMNQSYGTYCIIPLPLLGICGFIFLFKALPESRGKTVSEIVQPWMPARKYGSSRRARSIIPKTDNEIEMTDF